MQLIALQKRGLLKSDDNSSYTFETKTCSFCGETVGFTEITCSKCKHILNRENVLNEKDKDEEINRLQKTIQNMDSQFKNLKQELLQEMTKQILESKYI